MPEYIEITILGPLVVFAALGSLYVAFILMGRFLSPSKKEIEQTEPAERQEEEQVSKYDTRLVAAISAAVISLVGEEYRIRSIRRSASSWKKRDPVVFWYTRRRRDAKKVQGESRRQRIHS